MKKKKIEEYVLHEGYENAVPVLQVIRQTGKKLPELLKDVAAARDREAVFIGYNGLFIARDAGEMKRGLKEEYDLYRGKEIEI